VVAEKCLILYQNEKGPVGKPRKRWLDDAENDLKRSGVMRRTKIVRD
jgi:hypothetical protein